LSPSFFGFFVSECCRWSWLSERDWSSLSPNVPSSLRRW
jgi:hypothetical protein